MIDKEKIVFFLGGEEKRKRQKIFGEGKYFVVEKKKNGGKYLEGKKSFFWRKRKNGEGKGGKCLEKEKIFFCGGDEEHRWKRRQISWRRKN